jgi:hypothetical protein
VSFSNNQIIGMVIRLLPTAAVRVQCQVSSCEISGEQTGTGAGFNQELPFPLLIIIPPNVSFI